MCCRVPKPHWSTGGLRRVRGENFSVFVCRYEWDTAEAQQATKFQQLLGICTSALLAFSGGNAYKYPAWIVI
jgi:hypothetical protein